LRIAVTGAEGLLGREIVTRLRDGHEAISLDLPELDVTDAAAVRLRFTTDRPDVVVHAAAWTDVDACEGDPGRAFTVNARGSAHVAAAALEIGARVVLVGTDYVFDGKRPVGEAYEEDDEPAPLSRYGESKLLAERLVSESGAPWTVVRTQALFGPGGVGFVDKILAAARRGDPLRVVDDQWTCPTYAPHLAACVVEIVAAELSGILHASATGACSWLELARETLDRAGLASVPIEPVSSEELARPAPRPRNGVLRNRRLEETIGDRMPHWHDGLAAHLEERETRA
jgi:dTDP-4-dehydrorhamnose reductase